MKRAFFKHGTTDKSFGHGKGQYPSPIKVSHNTIYYMAESASEQDAGRRDFAKEKVLFLDI